MIAFLIAVTLKSLSSLPLLAVYTTTTTTSGEIHELRKVKNSGMSDNRAYIHGVQ